MLDAARWKLHASPFLFSLALLLFLPAITQATTPANFPHQRTLLPPAAPSPDQGASGARGSLLATVEIDAPILANTHDTYRDLRLFDQADTAIPSVVRPRRRESTVIREYNIAFAQSSFRLLPDNRIELVVHITNALDTPVAIVIDTPLDNFEKQVAVSGSPDGNAWEPLVARQAIFDYARFMSVRHLRIDLPDSPHAYFRIEIDNIAETQESPFSQIERDRRGGAVHSEVDRRSFTREDFRIDRVRLIGRRADVVKQELLLRDYPITDVHITHDTKMHVTTVICAIHRAPITQITLASATPNFSRHITVEGRSPPGSWTRIMDGTLQRIRTTTVQQEQLTLSLPRATRVQELRLVIHNLDSPPLVLDQFSARGETHELVFFTDAAHRLRLLYGEDTVDAPRYDVASALLDADTALAATYTLAPPEPNPAYRGPRTGGWWNSRTFLVAAVLLMVAVLGWALSRATKQLAP